MAMQIWNVGQHLVAAESERQVRKIMREEGIGYRGMKVSPAPGPFAATADGGDTTVSLSEADAIEVWGKRPGLIPSM